MHRLLAQTGAAFLAAACLASVAHSQEVGFWFNYPGSPFSVTDLGSAVGVASPYGGICFMPGDPETLLIAEHADAASSAILKLPVVRDAQGHIASFGTPSFLCTAPGLAAGGLDGALVAGPNDVLFYTTYPDNTMGQIKPDSTAPDKLIDLTPLGVAPSTGGVAFIPPGLPHAGEMRIASWSTGDWYHADFAPDGNGTFDLANVAAPAMVVPAFPEAMLYLQGDPSVIEESVAFTSPYGWMLVTKWLGSRVDLYPINANGDPTLGFEIPLVADVDCIVGIAQDPLTGDVFLSLFDCTDRIIRLSGLPPAPPACPGDVDHDGGVGGTDLGILLSQWGSSGSADFDHSGSVDAGDLSVLLGGWGPCG